MTDLTDKIERVTGPSRCPGAANRQLYLLNVTTNDTTPAVDGDQGKAINESSGLRGPAYVSNIRLEGAASGRGL